MADEETKDGAAQEEPKIIIDDDWKSQAQAEKEKLAQEVEVTSLPLRRKAVRPRASRASRPVRASFRPRVSARW